MSAFVVSKRHIDILVQSALAGATNGERWLHPGEHFRWIHDGNIHELHPELDEPRERGTMVPDCSVLETPASTMGQVLVDECVRSVSYRYPNDDVDAGDLPGPCDPYYVKPYVFEPTYEANVMVIGARGLTRCISPLVSLAELAAGIFCYEYQSCEHPDWRSSEAHAICAAFKDKILHALPGYGATSGEW